MPARQDYNNTQINMVQRSPKLEPLDIWVWELMAEQRLLDKALCVPSPLAFGSAGAAVGSVASIKEQQDCTSAHFTAKSLDP